MRAESLEVLVAGLLKLLTILLNKFQDFKALAAFSSDEKTIHYVAFHVMRLSCISAALAGKCCTDMISCDYLVRDHLLLASFFPRNFKADASAFSLAPFNSESWSYRCLFCNGRSSISAASYKDLELEEGGLVLDWVLWTHRGSVAENLYNGAMQRLLGSIFVSLLHHGGMASSLKLLEAHLRSLVAGGKERSSLELPLPLFLSSIWHLCTQIPSIYGADDVGLEEARERAIFLLEFEPQRRWSEQAERLCKCIIAGQHLSPSDNASTNIFALSLRPLVGTIASFVFGTTPPWKISAFLSINEMRLKSRLNGLRSLRSLLSVSNMSMLMRSVSALHLPNALRSSGPLNLFHDSFMISSRKDDSVLSMAGYYLDGTFGASADSRSSLVGAFVNLYEYLTELLDTSVNADAYLSLMLLNSLSVTLREEDHDMLARVDVFQRLRLLLESATTATKNGIDLLNGRRIVRASRKMFFLLTLQVAHTNTKGAPSQLLHSTSFNRVRSGPATLTKSVFDILYDLVRDMTLTVKASSSLSPKSVPLITGHVILRTDLPFDHSEAVNEVSVLLLQLYSSPECHNLLCSAAWLVTLLDFCIHSPSSSQCRLLQILGGIMEHVTPTSIDVYPQTLSLLQYCFGVATGSFDVSEKFIEILICLAAKVYGAASYGNVVSNSIDVGVASEASYADAIYAVSAEAVAILQKLLFSSREGWMEVIEKVLQDALRGFVIDDGVVSMNASSLHSLRRRLIACNVLGAHHDLIRVGSRVREKGTTRHFSVVSFSNRDTVIVAENEGDLPVEMARFNVVAVANLPESLSDEVLRALIEAFRSILSSDMCVVNGSMDTSNTLSLKCFINDSYLFETLRCVTLKSMLVLFSCLPRMRELFVELADDEERISRSLINMALCGIIPSKNVMPSEGSSVVHPDLEVGAKVRVLDCGSYATFAGEIESLNNDGTLEVCFEEGLKLCIRKDQIVHDAEGLKKKTLLNHAGVADVSVLEEYNSIAMSRICQTQLKRLPSFAANVPANNTVVANPATSRAPPSEGSSIPLRRSDSRSFNLFGELSTARSSRSTWLRSQSNLESNTGSGVLVHHSSAEEEKIYQLEQLGFSRALIAEALSLNAGDAELALNYILNNGQLTEESTGETEMDLGEGDFDEEYEVYAEEMMLHLNSIGDESRLRGPVANMAESEVRGVSSPKEYHYDSRCSLIIPLYATPSLSAEKMGAIFPSDTVYAAEELRFGPCDVWLRVRLADHDDDQSRFSGFEDECELASPDADGGSPFPSPGRSHQGDFFAWLPRRIDGAEVILPGTTTEIRSALADPPCLLYSHDATYEIIGEEGVILREGIDLTSSELRVLSCGTIVRCDRETINYGKHCDFLTHCSFHGSPFKHDRGYFSASYHRAF